jgi:peptidyl-prolyl cis-trans isomerase SurA
MTRLSKRQAFAAILPVLLLLAGCASTPQPTPETTAAPKVATAPEAAQQPPLAPGAKALNAVAAIVNDDVITVREVIRESQPVIDAAKQKGAVDEAARREIRKTVLNGLIEKRLIDQRIKEQGIKIGDDEIRQAVEDVKKQNNNMTQSQLQEALKRQGYTYEQYEVQIREQLERLRLVSIEVRSKTYVSQKEAEEYYEANKTKYTEEEQLKARHIYIKIDEKSPAAEIQKAQQRAIAILAEAREGKDFAELAKSHSDDPAAKKDGGDLGTFKRGDMQSDLENAITALKPGEVGELVVTPSGIHIVKLEERIIGKAKPFEKVRPEIEDILYRKKQDDRFTQFMKELRSKGSVEIMDTRNLL